MHQMTIGRIVSNYVKDIQFDLIVPGVKALSHRQALLSMAQNAADYLNVSEKILYMRLSDREDIASSGIGRGVALPNVKMRRVRVPFTMLMTLDQPVKCDTPDGHVTDLYCLLISPAEDGPIHLRRLSRLSRLLRGESLLKRLRDTQDPDVMRAMLIDPDGWLMAA